VAHELRTPLTIIRGHLEVLDEDPDERTESIALVTDELDRMSRYVSDLLVLARADEPSSLRLEPVDLGEMTTALIQKAEALGARRWVLDEAPPAGVVAAVVDVDRLNQAMLNLAANAVEHTGEGAEIGLGVRVDGDRAQLWVRDTGRGVEPAVAATLFDRHARGASSRVTRPEGMGIGLSIVSAIARAHRGAVDVSSCPGAGATFTLTIPLDPEETTP
jgi:signal transduction histidine kinase